MDQEDRLLGLEDKVEELGMKRAPVVMSTPCRGSMFSFGSQYSTSGSLQLLITTDSGDLLASNALKLCGIYIHTHTCIFMHIHIKIKRIGLH